GEIAQGRMDVPVLAKNEKSPRSVGDILDSRSKPRCNG
ncbi:hypothetical protein ACVIJW_011107, partial [Bradyrhizobium barranii subsp. barranii]